MTEYMEEIKRDDPNAMLTPQQYFDFKAEKEVIDNESLQRETVLNI